MPETDTLNNIKYPKRLAAIRINMRDTTVSPFHADGSATIKK